jgi:lysophospholipase L1-like esterase
MRIDRTWLYAGLLFAGGVAIAKAFTQGPTIRPGQRLLLFGDSLSVGLATPMASLAQENGIVFDAVGQVGSTVGMWAGQTSLNAQLQAALANQPDVVLCSLGTNDEALVAASAQAELPGLDSLIALVRASGATLGWIGPPAFLSCASFTPNGFTSAIRQRIPSNDYFPSDNYDIPRGGDCLHPTVTGYAGWAGQIWQWMRCCSA